MKFFEKKQLALLLPLLISACAGKGGFDPIVVENDNNTGSKPKPSAPSSSADSSSGSSKPAEESVSQMPDVLGWSLDITRRNQAKFKEDGTKYVSVKRTRTDGVEIDFPGQAEGSLPIDPRKIKKNQKVFEPSSGFEHVYIGFDDYDSNAKSVYKGKIGSEYEVYIGNVGTLRYQTDSTAKALPKSEQEFTYNGIWAYMTDIDVLREELAPPTYSGTSLTWRSNGRKAGVDYSGSSEFDDVLRNKLTDFSDAQKGSNGSVRYKHKGHLAEFKVHFGEKRLTGKLSRTPRVSRVVHDAYTINATINGHRFEGNATVHPLKDSGNESNLYFKSGSKKVEGGFYGDTGQELAGSFLTDDKSLIVAFGAKRKEILEANTPLTHFVDGVRINIDSDEDFTPFALNNFSGAKYLFIDGYNIPLAKRDFISSESVKTEDGDINVTYCCNQFDSVKFGEINHKSTRHKAITNYDNLYDDEYYEDEEVVNSASNANKYAENRYFKDKYYLDEYQEGKKLKYTPFNRSLFLQGERSKDIPKDGVVKYKGSWQANIVHRNIPHSVTLDDFDKGTRAAFEANFNNKKLMGQLWRKDDVSNLPSVLIEADIKGVAFEGIAKTGAYGINIDPDKTLNNKVLRFNVPTKGLFYGENATELGGSFSFSGIGYKDENNEDKLLYDKVGAVYGAKQVIEKK